MAGISSTPDYVINNNLYGSINCFNACIERKASLIFLSTSRVYPIHRIEAAAWEENETRFSFSSDQREPGITEKGISESLNIAGSRSFYGTTKLASELFIQEYAAFYQLKSAITRLGVIAGPRQMGKTDQGVVTLWMAKHFWKQPLKYIGYGGTGKQVRDLLHIEDLIKLVDMQIHHIDRFDGKIYNAGGGLKSSASLRELTEICTEITGNRIRIDAEIENRPADLRIYVTDNTQITNETGWHSEKTTESILNDTFNWIRDNEKQLERILK